MHDQDKKLIEELGGPKKVADLLGYADGGIQRVQNWLTRGIPAKVKVDHPEIFLKQRNGANSQRADSM